MRVLILANYDVGLYKFRRELIQSMLAKKIEIDISVPEGEYTAALTDMGCNLFDTRVDRRGRNPLTDAKLFINYLKIIKMQKPDYVLTYTVKPNIYGGIAASVLHIPYLPNITGISESIKGNGHAERFLRWLYKLSLKKAKVIFFQNNNDEEYFAQKKIAVNRQKVIPGSGVNLSHYAPIQYPPDDTVEFVFIARIMKEKGIDEYLSAAEAMRAKYPQTRFHICGFYEEDYEEKIKDMEKREIIRYHGMVSDIRKILAEVHCTVLPSYHEGMSNVLLESASCARPVIASVIAGCQETFDEGISGFGVKPQDKKDLEDVMEKFVLLPYAQKKEMGIAGRKKVEKCFDRKLVIDAYMRELE